MQLLAMQHLHETFVTLVQLCEFEMPVQHYDIVVALLALRQMVDEEVKERTVPSKFGQKVQASAGTPYSKKSATKA